MYAATAPEHAASSWIGAACDIQPSRSARVRRTAASPRATAESARTTRRQLRHTPPSRQSPDHGPVHAARTPARTRRQRMPWRRLTATTACRVPPAGYPRFPCAGRARVDPPPGARACNRDRKQSVHREEPREGQTDRQGQARHARPPARGRPVFSAISRSRSSSSARSRRDTASTSDESNGSEPPESPCRSPPTSSDATALSSASRVRAAAYTNARPPLRLVSRCFLNRRSQVVITVVYATCAADPVVRVADAQLGPAPGHFHDLALERPEGRTHPVARRLKAPEREPVT